MRCGSLGAATAGVVAFAALAWGAVPDAQAQQAPAASASGGFLEPAVAPTRFGNAVRWAAGLYEYRSAKGVLRARERFRLTVQQDGSRTTRALLENGDARYQQDVIQRVDRDFRPQEVHTTFWAEDTYRGSATITVSEGHVLATVVSPTGGSVSQALAAPGNVTLIPHVMASDGWHVLPADLERAGRGKIVIYNVDLGVRSSVPFLGTLMETEVVWVGMQTIEVPAGRFEAQHYRIPEFSLAIWTTGPDRIVVRVVDEKRGRQYLLTELERGT